MCKDTKLISCHSLYAVDFSIDQPMYSKGFFINAVQIVMAIVTVEIHSQSNVTNNSPKIIVVKSQNP